MNKLTIIIISALVFLGVVCYIENIETEIEDNSPHAYIGLGPFVFPEGTKFYTHSDVQNMSIECIESNSARNDFMYYISLYYHDGSFAGWLYNKRDDVFAQVPSVTEIKFEGEFFESYY